MSSSYSVPVCLKKRSGLFQDLGEGFDTVESVYGDLTNVQILTLDPAKDPEGKIIRQCVERFELNLSVTSTRGKADLGPVS